MKSVLCSVLFLAAIHLGSFQSASNQELLKQLNVIYSPQQSHHEQALEGIAKNLARACPNNVNNDKIENVTNQVKHCWEEVKSDTYTMCSMVKNNGERCSQPVVTYLEECWPEKAQEVPKLIQKMVVATFEHLCQSNGETIFELANPCFQTMHSQTQRCLRLVKSKFQKYETEIPSKGDFCEVLSSLKGCLQSHLQVACLNEKTRESFLKLYDAIRAPCDTDRINELASAEESD